MEIEIDSFAEQQAKRCEASPSFSGLNLLHIKRQLAELLRHIGEESIFAEYTRHDLHHVNVMLKMLDWLVPDETKLVLTDTDWLMTVLAIYFHDLGLLVTRNEFESRDQSTFPKYKSNRLLTQDRIGADYAEKVSLLGSDQIERFLYQEFVRAHHAERIRSWITSPDDARLGAAAGTAHEVVKLLEPLGAVFNADLAMICESHHLDDLELSSKYKIRRHYGSDPSEVCNLQYSAILLRTTDLLHITKDRTPSVGFRLIDPAHPVSREEWAKQMAVIAVSPAFGRDRDGNLREDLPRDTIEVHADFDGPNGFFALTSYLAYAATQLNASHLWVTESRRRFDVKHDFPWRDIDQSHIETKGFLARQFQFELDQYKILELLTGHTLYNDSDVVVRELAQNAIDAVRLQNADSTGVRTNASGNVWIHWSPADRLLQVTDNGTGMTQQIIEDNLLKVGSSRYHEKKFRERFPDFSPISRFGIGVLSAFMIADTVEIVTVHPDEPLARHLSLRDVHGKYLIRLVEKDSEEVPEEIKAHGTRVRLKVRGSAKLARVEAILRKWFVLPGCSLTYSADEEPTVEIGSASLRDALEQELSSSSIPRLHLGTIKVETFQCDGLDVAVAVRWSDYLRVWDFVNIEPTAGFNDASDEDLFRYKIGGSCIEGVRVRLGTPGYSGESIVAMSNASGLSAPRTNVARSEIDETPEFQEMLRKVYRAYCSHIESEVTDLHGERGFSTSRAVNEGRILAQTLLSSRGRVRPENRRSLELELRRLPLIVVDDGESRRHVSLDDLESSSPFYSVDSALHRQSERLSRVLPGDIPMAKILALAGPAGLSLPGGPLVELGFEDADLARLFYQDWEPARFVASQGQLDVEWQKRRSEVAAWAEVVGPSARIGRSFMSALEADTRAISEGLLSVASALVLPKSRVATDALDDFDVVALLRRFYVINFDAVDALNEVSLGIVKGNREDALSLTGAVWAFVQTMNRRWLNRAGGIGKTYRLDQALGNLTRRTRDQLSPFQDVLAEKLQGDVRVFDTLAWERQAKSTRR